MQKLPSGSYRKQVYLGKDKDGKKVYKSVTARTKSELKMMEAELRLSVTHITPSQITFRDAGEQLLASKSNVISPSTLRGYRSILRNFTTLDDYKVTDITERILQSAVNDYAMLHAPKSCMSAYSLALDVIRSVNPGFHPKIKLPQKQKYEAAVPSEKEIRSMISAADHELSIAIMLSAFGPLRRGECCAIKYGDIKKNTIHVHADMIKTDNGYQLKPTPKSSAGDRYVEYPEQIIRELGKGRQDEFIIKTQPHAIYKRFATLCKQLGLQHYRFHDLRVFGASYLHAKGFPNSYIMERGGWDTETVLVQIYRKSLSDESKRLTEALSKDIVSSFF